MSPFALKLAAVAVALAAGGFLLAWAGLVPIAASSGHWAITEWFLHFTMRQSVKTRALGVEPPALADPALVLRGAGHYATGCAPCHGAPQTPRAEIVRHMTPEPPYLPPRIEHWTPRQLFWIVKHGVKFTAMPAWPALQRDDEVWAMVAFLLRLPELDLPAYRRLAYNEPERAVARGGERRRALAEPVREVIESCARCHGTDGGGRGSGAIPRLTELTQAYFIGSLRAYAAGERFSGIMQPVAAGLDEATMRELARHYLDPMQAPPPVDAPRVDRAVLRHGERIAERGIPEQDVPACVHCHGPETAPRNPYYPSLAGQYADYLTLQLELFIAGRRGGTAYAHVMAIGVGRLTGDQIHAVATYYASLQPERPRPDAPLLRRAAANERPIRPSDDRK